MALVVHFDLELCQMDVKMGFVNDLEEHVYMEKKKRKKEKLERFSFTDGDHLLCRLKQGPYRDLIRPLKQNLFIWFVKNIISMYIL